jgi:hypothetical protein
MDTSEELYRAQVSVGIEAIKLGGGHRTVHGRGPVAAAGGVDAASVP